MKMFFGFMFGLLIGIVGTNLALDVVERGGWESGYRAATQQIRLQLERGHQGKYNFYIDEWPDIRFYPRGDRTGVNYEFKKEK